MKSAFRGDTHLGRTIHGHDISEDIEKVMYRFWQFCEEHDVTCAVHLGDLFDSPKPTLRQQTMALKWCNHFERSCRRLFIITGNHEGIANAQTPTACEIIKQVPYDWVKLIDRPYYDRNTLPAAGILFLPFPSPGISPNALHWHHNIEMHMQGNRGEPYFVASHLNVDGARLGRQDWVYRGGDYLVPTAIEDDERCQLIVNGHIHKKQHVKKVFMPGSALPLNFGEADHQAQFTIVSGSGSHLMIENFPIDTLSFRNYDLDVSAFTNGSALTTAQAVAVARSLSIEGVFVRVKPAVDVESHVEWHRVAEALYGNGARHVVIDSPIRVGHEAAQKVQDQSVGDPIKAAKIFVKGRIPDAKRQADVLDRFLQAKTEVEADA